MPFRGALVSRGMFMKVSIDQMTNDSYFPTQKKNHLHVLEGYQQIFAITPLPTIKYYRKGLRRLSRKNHQWEQAGFRSSNDTAATTDHIQIVKQLTKKCGEYNIPLCIVFVDYEKSFDSVQTRKELSSLQEQGIAGVYIELLKEIYTNSSMIFHLHKDSN